MGQIGLPSAVVRHYIVGATALGRRLGILARHFIAEDALMVRDPMHRDPAPPCSKPGGDFGGSNRESLTWPNAARSDPLGGRCGVHKGGIPPTALLPLVRKAEGLIDGAYLRIEDLLVRAQVEAVSGPPTGGPLNACRSCPAVVESDPSVQMVSPRDQAPAARSAPALLSTICPGNGWWPPHSCLSTVSLGRREAAALRRVVMAGSSLSRTSSGCSPPLGLAWSRYANVV